MQENIDRLEACPTSRNKNDRQELVRQNMTTTGFTITDVLTRSLPTTGSGAGFWLPEQAAEAAPMVDNLFYYIYYVSVFFFLLIIVLMTIFIFLYRKPLGGKAEGKTTHNTVLEILWSGIPLALCIVMFYYGFIGYLDLNTPMGNSYEIKVNAKTWVWNFTYPNGYDDSVLHVPSDRPTKLVMTSSDVIHSFFVPVFRVKRDVVPGRYNYVWFQPTRKGTFDVLCTEYCGKGHSEMITKVVVENPDDFQSYLASLAKPNLAIPQAERGKILWQKKGCYQCHSLDGAPNTGPSWKDMFGLTNHEMNGGQKLTVDENYVRESILNPTFRIVKGYEGRNMPSYQGQITDWQIDDLLAFMKTLSTPYQKTLSEMPKPAASQPTTQEGPPLNK